MSTRPDLDRSISEWLAAAVPDGAPQRLLEASRARIRTTQQRRAWWPARRNAHMNQAMRIALASAAVVAVALIGISLYTGGNVGGPGLDATPSPAQEPSPAPTPVSIQGTTELDPGTYAIGTWFPVQFDLTITDNWETWGADGDIVRIWKPCEVGDCYSAILTFEIVDFPYIDPCAGTVGQEVGDGVEDLVNALANVPGFEAGPVTDVSLDGYAGKSFDFAFVGDADQSCVGDATWQWLTGDDRVGWGPDADQRVIVLDVDGTRLVVDAVTYSGDRQEMDAIIDSIDFH